MTATALPPLSRPASQPTAQVVRRVIKPGTRCIRPRRCTSNPVSAGDKITATVTRTVTNTYRLDISDTTKGWSKTVTKRMSSKHASAEAIIESLADSCPNIVGGLPFTGVKFNGANLNATSRAGLDADDRGTYTCGPSVIGSDGASFSMTRNYHET